MENQLLITLSRNKLLKNVDISSINLRGIIGRLVTIGEGEILYREGDPAEEIYLVISGEINVLKKRLLGKTKSYIFTENDFLGHDEYFEETSRTSTAVALRDSYLITLSRNEIDLLIKQDDEIIVNLREPISQLDEETFKTSSFTSPKDEVSNDEFMPQFTSEIESEEETDYIKPKTETEDPPSYFNSISDVSKTGYENLIQPLEKLSFTNVPENKPQET
ncbi:MAG: cyclic nucleotide-binding domain-containing protein, partial [Ignavibacteria bacterium]|nr:cyclic nucleotide-binding domain-containing protein [Ignavibacteria bacterium]